MSDFDYFTIRISIILPMYIKAIDENQSDDDDE